MPGVRFIHESASGIELGAMIMMISTPVRTWPLRVSAALLAGLLLGACSSTAEQDDAAVENRNVMSGEPLKDEATTQPVVVESQPAPNPLDDPNSLLSSRVIYFDYDSSDVRAEDQALVEAHANYLAQNPGQRVLLEGHADERGSREYNVALGERRALAIGKLMQLLGVSDTQMRAVSYGEERPAEPGHDEGSWALNRRVELVYRRPGQS
ncbi:MAG: peptidoglycan-associated lipoprotein Pal [Pseudomonadota bacterium]